jgi:hypothetical protein
MSVNNLFDIIVEKTSETTSSGILLNETNHSELWNRVRDFMASDPTYDYTIEQDNINSMIFWSVIINNIISELKYENVLVVPSFRNSEFPSLRDEDAGRIAPNLVSNIWPFINKHFNCSPDIYVAYPDDHNSFARNLMREFGVSRISANKRYVMGDGTYMVDVPDDIKFDCVVLAGHPMNDGETFDANDIKSDFAPVCNVGFDIIDTFDSHESNVVQPVLDGNAILPEVPRITGTRRDMSEIAERINSSIHIKAHLEENNKALGNLDVILSRLSEVIKKEFRVY